MPLGMIQSKDALRILMSTKIRQPPTDNSQISAAQNGGKQRARAKFILILATVLILLVFMAIVVGPVPAMVIAVMFSPITFGIWRYRSSRIATRQLTEDDYEREWTTYENRRVALIQAAHHASPEFPVGTWKFQTIEFLMRGFPKILEERLLEMSSEGIGVYQWKHHEINAEAASTFRVRPGARASTFQAQLLSPYMEEWFEISYGFQVIKDPMGVPELKLWLDSANPLDEELKDRWPFHGTFAKQSG
jgi:hypothetical protein